MPLLLDINAIFDIEEEDMVISDGSDHELDNMLDSILDATDCA
ncbi:7776_t:CDS:1, partial [Gigaspora rosea]